MALSNPGSMSDEECTKYLASLPVFDPITCIKGGMRVSSSGVDLWGAEKDAYELLPAEAYDLLHPAIVEDESGLNIELKGIKQANPVYVVYAPWVDFMDTVKECETLFEGHQQNMCEIKKTLVSDFAEDNVFSLPFIFVTPSPSSLFSGVRFNIQSNTTTILYRKWFTEFFHALDRYKSNRSNCFVTGFAGTGKSNALYLKACWWKCQSNCRVVFLPTGKLLERDVMNRAHFAIELLFAFCEDRHDSASWALVLNVAKTIWNQRKYSLRRALEVLNATFRQKGVEILYIFDQLNYISERALRRVQNALKYIKNAVIIGCAQKSNTPFIPPLNFDCIEVEDFELTLQDAQVLLLFSLRRHEIKLSSPGDLLSMVRTMIDATGYVPSQFIKCIFQLYTSDDLKQVMKNYMHTCLDEMCMRLLSYLRSFPSSASKEEAMHNMMHIYFGIVIGPKCEVYDRQLVYRRKLQFTSGYEYVLVNRIAAIAVEQEIDEQSFRPMLENRIGNTFKELLAKTSFSNAMMNILLKRYLIATVALKKYLFLPEMSSLKLPRMQCRVDCVEYFLRPDSVPLVDGCNTLFVPLKPNFPGFDLFLWIDSIYPSTLFLIRTTVKFSIDKYVYDLEEHMSNCELQELLNHVLKSRPSPRCHILYFSFAPTHIGPNFVNIHWDEMKSFVPHIEHAVVHSPVIR